jgi:2,4-dienoyl-CoA reductase-like NADH-dependent reductase (Old Yellow Enzyme family)/thioredoxin reductase
MELKNRLVGAAINSRLAEYGGYVSQRIVNHYARRAQGGVGLIIIADGGVSLSHVNGYTQLRIADDSFIPGLTKLTQGMKENGAKSAIQLQHAGWRTGRWVGLSQAIGPTALTSRELGEATRAMTVEEIKVVVREFAQAARRAKQAGFDAVEIHGAHGYLVSLFLSPYTNWRQDEYGGDIERRARLSLEIIAAVRREVGKDYPIIFRISADEFVEGGLILEETRIISQWLEKAGVDCISVSGGTEGTMPWCVPCMLVPRGHMVPLAAAIKEVVSIPVMAVGRISTATMAEDILEKGKANLICLGRPLLADPDWPRKVREDKEGEIRKCVYCNSCHRDPPPEGYPIMCIVNPEIGREYETEMMAPREKKILIIGGGPAGLEAARVSRLRGNQITLWEEAPQLGGRWSWLIKGYITEAVKVLKILGVKIELGKAVTPQIVATLKPDAVLVTPQAISPKPSIMVAEGENVFWADDVLDGKLKVSGKVVVIGNNNIGCEVANSINRQGAMVTVIGDSSIIGYGLNPMVSAVLVEQLKQRGVQFCTGFHVKGIQEGRVLYQDSQGHGAVIKADTFVIAQSTQTTKQMIEDLEKIGLAVHELPYCDQPGFVRRAIRIGASVARQL